MNVSKMHAETIEEPQQLINCSSTNGKTYSVPTTSEGHNATPNGNQTNESYLGKNSEMDCFVDSDETEGEKLRPATPSSDSTISISKSEKDAVAPQKGPNLKSRVVGFLLGCLASLILTIAAACVQGLQGAVPDFQLAAMRGLSTFVAVAPIYVIKREIPLVPRRLWLWLFIYSMLGAVYHMTQYVAIRLIPLGVSSCIVISVLMISVTLMARLVLKELLSVVKLVAVVVSILGVFLVIQPEGIFDNVPDYSIANVTNNNNSSAEPERKKYYLEAVFGYILACVAGFVASSITIIQKAKLRGLSPILLNFYPAITRIIVSFIVSLIFEDLAFPSDADLITLVLIHCIAAAAINILIKRSIHMTTAILSSLALCLEVVLMLVAQYTVLKDIRPGIGNWVEIFGAATVTLAVVIPPAWDVAKKRFKL